MKRALRLGLLTVLLTWSNMLFALEPWHSALASMPLRTNVVELTKTNCVPLLLNSFQENPTARALIFMPGATDELYFFNRGDAIITNDSPSIWDALVALTNQTFIRVTFQEPFVLLHSAEDPLQPSYTIRDQATVDRVTKKKFIKHVVYNDRDWDYLVPIFSFQIDTKMLPEKESHGSWHFYRHSFAAWNLNGWEALQALSLAGKTVFTVQKRKIIFEGDTRFRARPPVPEFPTGN